MRRTLTFVLLVAVAVSCSKDTTAPPPPPPTIAIAPESATVDLFDTLRLQATVRDANGNILPDGVTWTSSAQNTVVILPTGRVQGLNRGTVTVTASADGGSGTARIKVKINVIAVQLAPTPPTLQVGDTVREHVTLFTADGLPPDDSLVAWSSSDTTTAVVSPAGLVTARAQGAATITGQVDSATGHASYTIPEPVGHVVLSLHVDTLRLDSLVSVTATILGAAGDTLTGRAVTWTTSDSTIAALSTNVLQANIGGRSAGHAVVRATSGGKSDSCLVVVVRPSVTSIHVVPTADTILADSSVAFTAILRDSVGDTLTGRTISWTSSDTAVATISSSGLATAHGAGIAHIRAAADAKTDSATLVSIRPSVTSIDLTPDTGHVLTRASKQLQASLLDSVGDTLVRPVTWTSLSPGVASVSSSGLVVGLTAGAATIKAMVDAKTAMANLTIDTVFAHPVEVQAGEYFTCVRNADGGASCWGANGTGATGHLPESEACDSLPSCIGTPVAVKGALTFSSIVTGGYHACGLASDGSAYCWGLAGPGQVGNGPAVPCQNGGALCTDGPILVSGGLIFSSLAAGQNFTCGIASDSTAYCWGFNGNFQLGGDSVNTGAHYVPIPVFGGLKFTQLALGALHACGLAAGGSAYCWGSNENGEVGVDSSNPAAMNFNIPVPTAVLGGHAFVQIAAGWYHTCGRIADGTTFCWGSNGYGMLGNGTTSTSWLPVVVPNGWRFAALSAGEWSTCGLVAGGGAKCWGLNFNGQLGIGTIGGQATSPTDVAGGLTFATIAIGGYHACGISTGGLLYCWGDNSTGQAGLVAESTPLANPTIVTGQP